MREDVLFRCIPILIASRERAVVMHISPWILHFEDSSIHHVAWPRSVGMCSALDLGRLLFTDLALYYYYIGGTSNLLA